MKILIEECVDQKLRLLFTGHDCQTAAYAKLAGLKNGVLLIAAESAGFELMITTDQEIPFQQNLGGRRIAILILCAPTKPASRPEPLGARSDACNGVHHTRSGAPDRMRTPSPSGRRELLAGLGGKAKLC